MKIVFITPSYFPSIGGVERHVEGVVKELSKNHQVTIVTEQTKEKSPDNRVIQIPTLGISEKNKKWVVWKWVLENQKIIDEADVIHVHDVMYWLYPYKFLHPFKKIFITFHGWEGTYPIPVKNIILHKINELLSSGNICVGDFISKWYGTKAGIVTYGAADNPKILKKSKVNSQKILFIGRLAEDTGFRQCLDLSRPLIIAGDGPLRYLVPKNAEMLGFVSNPEKYMTFVDYVYASGYLTILEAFTHKKIVLASYSNPVKKDYLIMHPMAKHIGLNGIIPNEASDEAFNWAKDQTWQKLASQYITLWQK